MRLQLGRGSGANSIQAAIDTVALNHRKLLQHVRLIVDVPAESMTLRRIAEYGSVFASGNGLLRAKLDSEDSEKDLSKYDEAQRYPSFDGPPQQIEIKGFPNDGAKRELHVTLDKIEGVYSAIGIAAVRTACQMAWVLGQQLADERAADKLLPSVKKAVGDTDGRVIGKRFLK